MTDEELVEELSDLRFKHELTWRGGLVFGLGYGLGRGEFMAGLICGAAFVLGSYLFDAIEIAIRPREGSSTSGSSV